ncbi:MAG TPA: alcohol dehydrogenase catalytic domain-containing protein [Acidimicrobiales bacterium]|nr:alcohol dehydrogenase catalytic domain-containing protein [Acidimicrobiales bacterium]
MSDLPETMPAAVYRGPDDLVVEERPVRQPGPGQVLVEVDHCGICGSDIHLMLQGWGKPGRIEGHEWAGTVVALGDDVKEWVVGDTVVGGPSPRCGTCRRCREGKPSQCENRSKSVHDEFEGAFARFIRAGAASLVRVPDGLSSRDAALAEPLAVALHGITRSGVASGDSVMIFGAGPIGALSLAALRAKGIGPVTVVEPGEQRRRLAAEIGADDVIHPSELVTFPRWEPERISERAVDVVLECSGYGSAIEAGIHQLKRGGTLVLVGAGMDTPPLDTNRMLLNELQICGSFVYDFDGFAKALELLASGAIPTRLLIEPEDVTLDGIYTAMQSLASGGLAGKAMVVPRVSSGHEQPEGHAP